MLGSALAVTSEATKTIVLMQKNLLETKLGEIMVLASAIDNLVELLFLSLLLFLIGNVSSDRLLLFPVEVIAFFLAVFIALKLLPRIISVFKQESDDNYFSLAVLIGLGIALLGNALSLGTLIGAFVAGILLKKAFKSEKVEHAVENNLKIITFALVVPFFHLHIGLNVSLANLVFHPMVFLAVLAIGFAGKMIGALIVKPFTELSSKQLALVGWSMNSRGFMELIILSIASREILGFPQELYAAVILTTIITTIAFPIALDYYVKKDAFIMH